MRLRDRLLGPPEGGDQRTLRRALRYGSPALRIRASRELAQGGEAIPLQALLRDPVPGVRRAAARGLGWLEQASLQPALARAFAHERSDTVRCALAAARIRCGGAQKPVLDEIQRRADRRLGTHYGPRRPAQVTGSGGAEALRWTWLELGRQEPGEPRSRGEALAGWERIRRDPHRAEARQLLSTVAPHADAAMLVWMEQHWEALGRYGEHAFIEALGWLGDPRGEGRLLDLLRAMDTDPGRAFHHRHLAATALARIGDPGVHDELIRALEREALEFEGRPGAGLGIQFPVRNTLLWALGELGELRAAPVLLRYLGNTAGSATGGLHLPAMAALVKLGPAVAPQLRPLLDSADTVAANAAGVLAALGDPQGIERARRDPRPSVRAAASRPPPSPGT